MTTRAVKSPYLVPFKGSFSVNKVRTDPSGKPPSREACKVSLSATIKQLNRQQQMLYADNRFSVLCIFQAIDAAGKDSTIRAVTRGINPAGFQVYSFKQPSAEELDHDFLWRTNRCLPERGRIGIFNRSYYEEVLVVRVHPEYLKSQRLPQINRKKIWQERYDSIREHERHLARNGTVILKFWLNVSKDEQRKRFLDRIRVKKKNWKFSNSDLEERKLWKSYMSAFQQALSATSRPWAPWYAVPADDKPFMRLTVAKILLETLKKLKLSYPRLSQAKRDELRQVQARLESE